MDKLKNRYFVNKFSNNKNNGKKIWSTINDLLGRNKCSKINMIELDDNEISDQKEIAKNFNEYFTSIAKKTQDKLDPPKKITITLFP